jgi:hypothetical protein
LVFFFFNHIKHKSHDINEYVNATLFSLSLSFLFIFSSLIPFLFSCQVSLLPLDRRSLLSKCPNLIAGLLLVSHSCNLEVLYVFPHINDELLHVSPSYNIEGAKCVTIFSLWVPIYSFSHNIIFFFTCNIILYSFSTICNNMTFSQI